MNSSEASRTQVNAVASASRLAAQMAFKLGSLFTGTVVGRHPAFRAASASASAQRLAIPQTALRAGSRTLTVVGLQGTAFNERLAVQMALRAGSRFLLGLQIASILSSARFDSDQVENLLRAASASGSASRFAEHTALRAGSRTLTVVGLHGTAFSERFAVQRALSAGSRFLLGKQRASDLSARTR